MKDYKWLKVVRARINRLWINANYKKGVITLYDNFFKLSYVRQQSVYEHEYAHHIFYQLPKTYQVVWRLISNWRLIKLLNVFWIIDYKENDFLNSHAKKNYKEDFSEQIELKYLIENSKKAYKQGLRNDCLMFKYKTAVSLYNKYK